jgi:micrococcal nuclease
MALALAGCGPRVSSRTAAAPTRQPPPDRVRVTVDRIVDGDTIVVRTGATSTRVRLLEIDTPEYGRFCAVEATRRTAELLPVGSTATVQPDRELLDRYGRSLFYVWNAHGVWVNKDLVVHGFARAVLYPPNDAHIAEIRAAEADAKRSRLGVWTDPEHAYTRRQLSGAG